MCNFDCLALLIVIGVWMKLTLHMVEVLRCDASYTATRAYCMEDCKADCSKVRRSSSHIVIFSSLIKKKKKEIDSHQATLLVILKLINVNSSP